MKSLKVLSSISIIALTAVFFQNCTNSKLFLNDIANVAISQANGSFYDSEQVPESIDPNNGKEILPEIGPTIDPGGTTGSADSQKKPFLSIRLIAEAGFRAPAELNRDMQIYRNRDGTYHVSSVHHDPECFKARRNLSDYEAQLLVERMARLSSKTIILPDDEPITVDGGSTRVEIVWLNGKMQTLELFENGALRQYELVLEGEDLLKIFYFIDSNMEVTCQ